MPFEMDDEFVRHALAAVTLLPEQPLLNLKSAANAPSSGGGGGSKRVDIRTLKKKKRAKEAERTRIRYCEVTQYSSPTILVGKNLNLGFLAILPAIGSYNNGS